MPKPPHTILFANHVGAMSGAEESLLALVRGLDRERFRPACACPAEGPLVDALRDADCEHVAMPFRRLHKTLDPIALAACLTEQIQLGGQMQQAIRATRARLVHSNSATAHLAAGLAAKRLRVPSIWHVRDLSPLGPLGIFLGRNSDKIITISDAVRQQVSRYAPAERIEVVHNGIDADAFAAQARPGALRAELGIGPTPLIGMVAQMARWKGHRVFLDAAAQVHERVPELAAVVVGADVFGDQAAYARELRQLGQQQPWSEFVRWLGYRRDVATIMADLDALVVPSFDEPFGRVALEAMALGTPVVASDSGGLPEIVLDRVTGRLCPTGDAAAFADALCELLTNPASARELGAAGAERVRDVFAAERMANRVAEIYEELLHAHRH